MARKGKRLLTWHDASGQWRKMFRGKLYYLGKGKGKSDRASYNLAVLRWKQIVGSLTSKSATADTGATPKQASASVDRAWSRKQISGCIAKFLDDMTTKADAGNINYSRVSDLKARLFQFEEHFKSQLITEIKESRFRHFYKIQTARIGQQKVKPSTLAQEFNAIRQFMKWCYTQRLIKEVPRNLGDLRVAVKNRRLKFFTKDQIQALFKSCNKNSLSKKWQSRPDVNCDLLRCAILLGLNCGMTQRDVADLRVGEVCLKKRPPRIIRKRSKTGVDMNFLLWRETQRHLKPYLEGKGLNDLVFRRLDGRPLIVDSESDGRKTGGRSEILGYQFRRLVERVIPKTEDAHTYRFRELRRTGADRCRQRHPEVVGLYLAHENKEMASRYVRPLVDRLDLMLTYMEQDFGFSPTLMRLPSRPHRKDPSA